VVAAFAMAHAAGCPTFDAIAFANKAAGIVVGKRGTATVSPEEFLASESIEAGLVEREGLRGLSMSLKAKSRRIVTAVGAFDRLHAGHLAYLRRARREGDVLVVGLRAETGEPVDPADARMRKDDRADMLLALRPVDFVHIFREDDAAGFLEAVRPDVHVVSAESGVTPNEAAVVERYGGRVAVTEPPGEATDVLSNSPARGDVRSPR
jgi:D-beta-D-heptose 7-phosphate kinase/D-beta-D-heptose 1-phosphate adenosyltransferase